MSRAAQLGTHFTISALATALKQATYNHASKLNEYLGRTAWFEETARPQARDARAAENRGWSRDIRSGHTRTGGSNAQ